MVCMEVDSACCGGGEGCQDVLQGWVQLGGG